MVDTKQLIEQLSAEAVPVRVMRPQRYVLVLLIVLLTYAVCAQCWLEGFRADIATQLARPLFLLELLLLVAMLVSSSVAAAFAMLPDIGQRKRLMQLPYILSGGLFLLVLFQLFMPPDARMVMADTNSHTHQCTQYIAVTSLLPAVLMFGLLRKGASIMPLQAGFIAVIAAVSVGAITLRLAEPNDQITHLIAWHYVPSLFFASLGALLGRYLLRW